LSRGNGWRDWQVGVDELDALRRELKLTRLENHLLREFVAQANLEQAVRVLMRRFIPKPEQGFAALVERTASGTTCEFSRGLADDSVASLRLSEAEFGIVQQARAITLEERSIDDSSLAAGLLLAIERRSRSCISSPSAIPGILPASSRRPLFFRPSHRRQNSSRWPSG
jgi:hypothetical protein